MSQHATDRAKQILKNVSDNRGPTATTAPVARTHTIDIKNLEKKFFQTRPSWRTINKVKNTMGVVLCIMGTLNIIIFSTSNDLHGTALATQTPADGEFVGKVHAVPKSRVIGVITPQLTIGFCSLITGLWTLASMNILWIRTVIMDEVKLFCAFTLYYQVCFQGAAIILTILPLAGVIDVYELAFAVALTWAELLMYLHSDITNALSMNNWEVINTAREPVENDPIATFRTATNDWTATPWLKACFKPLWGGILVHLFTWIIILIHLIEALSSDKYHIEPLFVVIVLFTASLQFMVPIFKTIQLMRLRAFPLFGFYKFVMMMTEVVEFVTMIIISALLMTS